MRKSISWILNFTNNLPNDKERIKCLQQNVDNDVLTLILRLTFDPGIEFLLPEGTPPYKVCEYPDQQNALYFESRKLYLFVKGGNDNLSPFRRETLFVELLQVIDPDDAKLLIAMKDKTLPYKKITKELVSQAFPNLY
jgi:hypothetical protein